MALGIPIIIPHILKGDYGVRVEALGSGVGLGFRSWRG